MMLAMSDCMKLAQPPGAAECFAHKGWPLSKTTRPAVLKIACTVVYLITRMKVLGHDPVDRIPGRSNDDAYFVHPLLGALLWAGLYARDEWLRALLPFTR